MVSSSNFHLQLDVTMQGTITATEGEIVVLQSVLENIQDLGSNACLHFVNGSVSKIVLLRVIQIHQIN